jgi:excisionase family DNA binding protein
VKQIMTPKEAAEVLGVHTATIYKLVKTGELPSVKLGPKLIRISESDLQKYIKPN